MSLLCVENIVKEYRSQIVLNGVSLRIEKGERVALIGPNGSGKTTLLKIALGKETPDSGKVVIARNTRIGYISQASADCTANISGINDTALHYEKVYSLEVKIREIEQQLETITKEAQPEQYNSLIRNYDRLQTEYEAMEGYTIRSRIKTILLGLGLREDVLNIPVSMLSGGEKMRVSIARVLLDEPDLIILDEPTNHLDMGAVEWLESFLKKYEGGVLFVSHDRYFLDQTATRLIELDSGTVIERKGGYSTFIEQKKKEKDSILGEQNRLKQEIKSQKQIARKLKSMNRIKAAGSRMKAVEVMEHTLADSYVIKRSSHLQSKTTLRLSFENAKHISAEIAKAAGLKKSFGSQVLFKDVSFLIRGGEHVGIVGDNGTGKSTLLNILRGTDKDFEGTAWLGSWVKYAYLSQSTGFEKEDITIIEEILARKEMQQHQALDYLSRFKFYGDDINKSINFLSGGEKVRLYMACIMLEAPDCLIMDEPTNHLDIESREALEEALIEYGGSIIAVSHDRYFLSRCADRILEISDGKISSYTGNYEFYRHTRLTREIGEPAVYQIVNSTISKYDNRKDNIKVKQPGNNPIRQKPDIREIEAQILELEEKSKHMEGLFDRSTPPEKYQEYDNLINETKRLYDLWESFIV